MAANERYEQIEVLVDERGFVSVRDLSEIFQVSEMTIRRDLQRLEEEGRLRRTFGGAASLHFFGKSQAKIAPESHLPSPNVALTDRVDVMIATSREQQSDYLLLDRAIKKNLPIVAESAPLEKEVTLVALDNYKAAFALGRSAGLEGVRRWNGRVHILDLTYRMPNTRLRSQAFKEGIQETCPQAELILSIDAQSSKQTSYQVTKDALTVHSQINVIFAINDTTAAGAIQACRELAIDPEKITILPFGLEGNTMRDALAEGTYCRLGLAMFPEVIAPACIEAAILAYSRFPLPPQLVTPFSIVTTESLSELYTRTSEGWNLRWDVFNRRFTLPIDIHPPKDRPGVSLPRRIGFIVPFSEHEWYRNLVVLMREHAQEYDIQLEFVDTEKDMYDEVENRRKAIAQLASHQVQPNDVLIIDNGPIAGYLAQNLVGKGELTVITNATNVFNILEQNPDITLISTGGVLRRASQVLVGPTAEASLRDLRADRLFLSVTGISLDFGLSHTNYSEVTIKQAMIGSAREVILLADYTNFAQESVAQVTGLKSVHRLITDDSLPANMRLDLAKLGIKLTLATI
ncbi:MAG TPA: DeoR family transcriptional regulator [Anaerolineaceae bacterium]|nr:DeoR family transcriptional regulator [Anaerolineaceae bacterium]